MTIGNNTCGERTFSGGSRSTSTSGGSMISTRPCCRRPARRLSHQVVEVAAVVGARRELTVFRTDAA